MVRIMVHKHYKHRHLIFHPKFTYQQCKENAVEHHSDKDDNLKDIMTDKVMQFLVNP